MRMRPSAGLAILVLPMILAATSSGDCRDLTDAGTGTDPVEVCESTGWFEPSGDIRIGNLAGLSEAAGRSEPALPTWGVAPPDASATEGGGASYTAHALAGESEEAAHGIAGARFEGTVTGNVDSLALDFYMVTSHQYDEYLPGSNSMSTSSPPTADWYIHSGGTYPVFLSVEVDSRRIDLGEVEAYLYPPSTSGNLLAMRFRTAVVGLFDGVDDPDALHDVAVQVYPHEDETTLLFDAVEWPSKIIFNKADMTSYKVVDAAHAGHDHEH